MKNAAIDRRLSRLVAICVLIIVNYYEDGEDEGENYLMIVEIHAIAAWAARVGVGYDRVEGEILRPVGDVLVTRYGREVGDRLYGQFRDAFTWRSWQLN